MTSIVTAGMGVVAIVFGVAWILWPTRMKRLQMKYLYFYMSDDDEQQPENLEWVGRITGGILAALGVAIVTGLLP